MGTETGAILRVGTGVSGKATAGADSETCGWFCTGTRVGLCVVA